MTLMEGLAQQIVWAARNTAFNLELIPSDKLGWKPAPMAKSALEIINHTAYWLYAWIPALEGGERAEPQFARATDLESAQKLIIASAEQYAAVLRGKSESEIWQILRRPGSTVPWAELAVMLVLDMIHHHGQIAYIQSLLGDDTIHFSSDAAWGTVLRGSEQGAS